MKKILFGLFLLLLADLGSAASLRCVPIQTLSNLPTNEIRKLAQDDDGYLWISTYSGLVRYDGYDIVVYKTDPTTGQQVLNSSVNLCVEDGMHTLWVGTHSGLFMLDKLTNSIHKVDFQLLNECRIEAIVPSADGLYLWIATNRGLFVRDQKTGIFQYCVGDQWNILTTDMKSMVEDKNGYLWIGTWNEGLVRYDVKHRRQYRYSKIPILKSSHTLFIDGQDNIWIGTWGKGLVRLLNPYDMDAQSYVQYQVDGQTGSILDNIIYAIAQEPVSGNIWVGSRSGLSILKDVGNSHSFENYSPQSGTLPYNEVNSILATNDKLMWIGSFGGGVFCVDTQSEPIRTDNLIVALKKYGTNAVSVMAEDVFRKKYWLAINGFGLASYDPENHTLVGYENIPALHQYSCLSRINDICEVPNSGNLLFATEQGIVAYDSKSDKAKWLYKETGYPFGDGFVTRVLSVSNGIIWVATRVGVGYISVDGRYYPMREVLQNEQTAISCMVVDMAPDKQGRMWLVTATHGIYRADPQEQKFSLKNYSNANGDLNTEGGNCILPDSKNRIWVGTEQGLLYYNNATDHFDPFSSETLRFYGGKNITNLWEDEDGNLWMATNDGVVEMHVAQDMNIDFLRTYSIEDGLSDNCFYRRAYCHLADGTAVLAGAHGLNFLPSKQILSRGVPSKIVITDFKIFGKSLSDYSQQERNKFTKKSLYRMSAIVLPHDKNNFSIEFALLNFKNSQQNHYSYQLLGYDKVPQNTDANHRFAYYNNLPSGKYTFVVKGADPNCVWSENDCRLQIVVKPPFWRSWWAYMIYICLILVIAYGIYTYIHNRERMKKEMALAELDKKKTEELSHAKLQFFTNITHELLTPLSIILASVEDLKQKDKKTDYSVISDNAIRLVRLIRQILEFRKAENGNLKLRVSKGNITEFVNKAIEAFLPLARQKNIHFFYDSESTENIIGFFDADKLDKILYNLLSNATKYNHPDGQVYVTLNENKDNHSVVLQVADNGIGIKQEEMDKLFMRFYDGSYRKQHTTGTGIGLSLVKDLVDLHHGTINVQSTFGKGSTFIVEIPIEESCYSKEEIDADVYTNEMIDTITYLDSADNIEAEEAVPSESADIVPATLLIVEDNKDLLSLMQRFLSTRYRSVLVEESADEAVRMLTQTRQEVDLILSDIMMPGMNGYDFCAFLKKEFRFSHIPVVLITAKQTSMDQIMAYEVGADGYITKPLNMHVLDAKIRRLLQSKTQVEVDKRKHLVYEPQNVDYTPEDERFLKLAVDCVNKHLADTEFDLVTFAKEMGMSRSTLNERLKSVAGVPPISFINDIRLHAAYNMIKANNKVRVSDLAYAVGFSDAKYFSTLFKKKFGTSPREFITQTD